MKKSTIRLALEALTIWRRRYAVEANLFKLGVVTHATVNANTRYDQITDAIVDLEGEAKPAQATVFSPVLPED